MNKKSLINKISLLYHIKMNGVMTWQKYDNEIIVISIKEADPKDILNIIKIILDDDQNKLFSITRSHDEITIIIDKSLDCFIDSYFYKETYVGYVLLDTGSFMEESGLLKKISTHFAQFEIPILYITTVNNNYLLVPKKYEEKTDQLIRYGIRL
ncbi:ACT domain protein [Klosneuvirus KNV1]|uniref:ACT domain protein n=1 Tax=Klosneuvirus KNV1 TaxID=1977640 RepID=A0A1V0SKJ7_9VIRU|nr:ACT domain protein [Klosneuvirus KNV1]